MNLHPEDQHLTDYLLDELSPEEEALVENASKTNREIYTSLVRTEQIRNLLSEAIPPCKATLLPEQRKAVLASLRPVVAEIAAEQPVPVPVIPSSVLEKSLAEKPLVENTIVFPPKKLPPTRAWRVPVAIAAVLTFGIIVLVNLPISEKTPVAQNEPVPQQWKVVPLAVTLALPAPGPPGAAVAYRSANARISEQRAAKSAGQTLALNEIDEVLKRSPIPSTAELPPITPRSSVLAAEFPSLPLPVQSGTASLGWIAQSVRGDGKLPVADAVRVEEILNSFPIKPVGTSAISQGVTVSTETLPCPWKPSATLLIVSVRGAVNDDREVQTYFNADPNSVFRYRLIGFAPVSGSESAALPNKVPAKSVTTLAIEIEPKGTVTNFGTIQWSVNGKAAAEIPLVRRNDDEPSDDSRFAALLCTYGQWLSGDQSGIIDAESVAALAREISSSELAPERHDLLTLIDQSLNL